MEADMEAIRAICGVTELQAERLMLVTGETLEDSCFLHWCLSGQEPDLYRVFYVKELRISENFHVELGPPEPIPSLSPQEVFQWRETPWTDIHSTNEQCAICMCAFEPSDDGEIIRLSRCSSHYFHKTCISQALQGATSAKCPVCGVSYGEQMGSMPAGVMAVRYDRYLRCDGYASGTWVVYYYFPDGVKEGQTYTGTDREAYLPNTEEGREVLRLLICAFYRRVTFTVGTSVTTGATNTVVWSGIHHKTCTEGGPTNFGYPDPGYFARVKEEMAARGVSYSQV